MSEGLVKLFAINDSRLTDVTWDGKDDAGIKVKSGVYFIKLKVKG